MTVQGLHHVAYRCNDARETTDFYTRFLDLGFNTALAENEVPSTGEWSPHIHIFFEMGDIIITNNNDFPTGIDLRFEMVFKVL